MFNLVPKDMQGLAREGEKGDSTCVPRPPVGIWHFSVVEFVME